MVNTMAKMRRNNIKVRRWLSEQGFEDITFFPHTRFSKDLHLMDLEFDGVCRNSKRICLFQAKSNKKQSKESREQFDAFFQIFGVIALWINCIDGGEIECLQ